MIPKHRLEEIKGEEVRVYIKDLPEAYCVQLGKIQSVGEHIIIFKDIKHNSIMYIPIDSIALIKKEE
ncbi:MAG: hypothetical protein ACFFHV_01440 [Promethearchaeota archaeon]